MTHPTDEEWAILEQRAADLKWALNRARATLQGAETALADLSWWQLIKRRRIRHLCRELRTKIDQEEKGALWL